MASGADINHMTVLFLPLRTLMMDVRGVVTVPVATDPLFGYAVLLS